METSGRRVPIVPHNDRGRRRKTSATVWRAQLGDAIRLCFDCIQKIKRLGSARSLHVPLRECAFDRVTQNDDELHRRVVTPDSRQCWPPIEINRSVLSRDTTGRAGRNISCNGYQETLPPANNSSLSKKCSSFLIGNAMAGWRFNNNSCGHFPIFARQLRGMILDGAFPKPNIAIQLTATASPMRELHSHQSEKSSHLK